MEERVRKLFSARSESEHELFELYQKIDDAISNNARRVRVDGLVQKCREIMLVAITKNDQLLALTEKADDKEKVSALLISWQRDLNLKHDQCMDRARLYIDSVDETASGQQSKGTNRDSAKSSRKSSLIASATSSQRRKDAMLATLRREEVERQNAANIRSAEQKF